MVIGRIIAQLMLTQPCGPIRDRRGRNAGLIGNNGLPRNWNDLRKTAESTVHRNRSDSVQLRG